MDTLAWIVGIVTVLLLLMAGVPKLIDHEMSSSTARRLGVPSALWRTIGGLEVAAAVGVVIGLLSSGKDLEWVGLAAGIGVIALMLGAIATHQRARDDATAMLPAVVVFTLAVVYLFAIGAR